MKNLFAAILLLVGTSALAQKSLTFQLTGIKPEIEKQMIAGDVIPSGFGYNNIMLRLKNTDQKNWTYNIGKIYTPVYDAASNHYTMKVTFTINESKYYSLEKPFKIVITVKTVYGNSIWTEFTCDPSAMPKTVELDHYNGAEGDVKRPATKSLELRGKEINQLYLAKMQSGESIAIKGNNVLIRVRYQDSKQWIAEKAFGYPDKLGRFFGEVALPSNFDIHKPFLVQAGVKTNYGNFFWGELQRNDNNMTTKEVDMIQFSGKIDDANAKLSNKPEAIQTTTTSTSVSPDNNSTTVTNSNSTTQSFPAIAASSSGRAGQKVDLVQQKATIEVDKKPDSLVDVYVKSVLTREATIYVGFQPIVLKSGTEITYNPKQGFASTAISGRDQSLKVNGGTITIKDNSKIELTRHRIKTVYLAKEAVLTTSIGDVSFGSGGSLFDMWFDDQGNLVQGITAKEQSFNAGGAAVTVPAHSALIFRNDKLVAVDPSADFNVTINGSVYKVSGTNEGPAMEINRKSGAIEELVIAEAPAITIEGADIPVKSQTKLIFEFENNQYVLRKFHVANAVKVKEYNKKGKSKDVEVKEGKRLTIEEGKVVDVGR